MQDDPDPDEILAAVAAFLRQDVVPTATAHTAFQARVAANALDLVRRHIALAPPGHAAEQARLEAILGREGDLATLNAMLAERLQTGALDLASPGVAGHLRATTMAKLAVDQPLYSGYRAVVDGG